MQLIAPLKVGIVGCGEHATENLLPSLWNLTCVEVRAVCDSELATAVAVARRFPKANAYPDFHALIASKKVDAIIAAAPPQVHRDVAWEALLNGIHIFVEKPPTVTTEELTKLAAFAKKVGLVTGVGHNLRHATACRQLQDRLQDPSFGRPICMDMRYFASKPLGDRWGLKSVLRSFLLSHANHALDLMVFHMGPVASTSAIANCAPNGSVTLCAQIAFVSGAVGNLLITTLAPHFALSVTVVGEYSTIAHLDGLRSISEYGLRNDVKRWGHYWTDRTLESGYEHAGYQTELELFANSVLRNDVMQPSFDDELAVYRLIDQIESQVLSAIGSSPCGSDILCDVNTGQ